MDSSGIPELTDLCASHSEGDDAALLVSDFWHNWSFQQGTGYWYPLYQGRIFEQEGVCRTASTSLHVEKAFGKLEINISPVSDNSVLAPRWADACSKIGAPGQCSWFHTGQDLTWLGLQNGEASYVSVETSTAGTFSWPDIQDFAYRICRDPNSSADCKTSGDLELTTTCTSRSVGDVDAILVNDAFEHAWSYQRGSYIWYSLYQGALSSSAVWTRKKAGDVTSSQGVQFVTAGNIESIDNTGKSKIHSESKVSILSNLYNGLCSIFALSPQIGGLTAMLILVMVKLDKSNFGMPSLPVLDD